MVDWKEQYLSFMSEEAIMYVQYSICICLNVCEVFCETSYSVHHRRLCEVPMQYRYGIYFVLLII